MNGRVRFLVYLLICLFIRILLIYKGAARYFGESKIYRRLKMHLRMSIAKLGVRVLNFGLCASLRLGMVCCVAGHH